MLPDVVYHYTTIPAYKSMVKHNQLWLTHYKHVNDTKELITGLNIVEERSRDYLSKCGEITSSIRLPQEVYDQYFLCFCARDDNAHLAYNYAQKSGVAIGFDRRALLVNPSINLIPMSYDLESFTVMCAERVKNLKPVAQQHEEELKLLIRAGANTETATDFLRAIPNYKEYKDTLSTLSSYATFIKNPDWIKEEEIRLVHWPFTCSDRGIPLLDIEYRFGRPRALLNFKKLPIVSVTAFEDDKILKRKGFLNFLEKQRFNYVTDL